MLSDYFFSINAIRDVVKDLNLYSMFKISLITLPYFVKIKFENFDVISWEIKENILMVNIRMY